MANDHEGLSKSLRRILKRLRRQERELFSQRRRLWAHDYLVAVYNASEELSSENEEALCRTVDSDEEDIFRELLARTTEANAKTQSRWLRALTYVNEVIDDEGGTVSEIFRRYGGITGCARAIATPKRAPGEKRRDWK